MKNVTVRVRACDKPIKIANLGYLGPTKMNHLEYFSRAYAQPRYRSAAAPWSYAQSLYYDRRATLKDLREAVTTFEDTARTARRVFGGAHPVLGRLEGFLRDARAALHARETPLKGRA